MLICYICGSDATYTATQCVVCKQFIDMACHGGVLGDGHLVCIYCSGRYIKVIAYFTSSL